MITLTKEQFNKIVAMVAKRDRLQAIKIVCDVLDYNLVSAKEYIDNLLGI